MTNSIAWVSHGRGRSVELVREREKECWDWLFREKTMQYIERKLNDVLPSSIKAVLVPAGVSLIVVNPFDPVDMVSALRDALSSISASYDVELTVWEQDPLDTTSPALAPEQRVKCRVLPKEKQCFDVLFSEMNLKGIADKLNIVWLPDHIKVIFISTKKSVILVDKKDPVTMVQQAIQLLRTIGSGYDLKLVIAPSTKIPLMEAV